MLNPCKNCKKYQIAIDGQYVYCTNKDCDSSVVKYDRNTQTPVAAWNAANPANIAENGQHEALEAVQHALAAVLFERFALEGAPIYRDDLWGCHSEAVDLLISQGVLVEIDGRITAKGV